MTQRKKRKVNLKYLKTIKNESFAWVLARSLQSYPLFEILWTVAHQTPLSVEFSKQEYWNGLPWSPPGDLPGPGIEPTSLMSPSLAGVFLPISATRLSSSLSQWRICLQCKRSRFDSWIGKIPWRRKWQPTPQHGNCLAVWNWHTLIYKPKNGKKEMFRYSILGDKVPIILKYPNKCRSGS